MLTRPLVVAACVVALAGCDKSASPTEPGRLPSAAGRARLTIDGAPSVPPGSTAQFRATTTAGVVQDVSREATWTTTNPAVLQSLGAGLFAAVSRGEANLVAVYGLGSAVFHVLVLESGTFVLRGTVSDSGVGLPGAIVQTIGGPGVDQSVTTDRSGRYALYGVAGAVSLNVTDTGYRPQAQTLEVSGDTTADVTLVASGDRPDINGSWRLTFTASSACADLPEEGRVRTYLVSIHQTGPRVQATLTLTSSAWSLTDLVPINAQLFAQSLTFTFPVDTFDGPAVYEHLPGGADFTLEGDASATYSAGRFDGVINGLVRVFTAATWPGTICTAPDHRWRLERMPPG